jgi:hypothetical protein
MLEWETRVNACPNEGTWVNACLNEGGLLQDTISPMCDMVHLYITYQAHECHGDTYSFLFRDGSGATAPIPLTLCFPAGSLSALKSAASKSFVVPRDTWLIYK